MRRFLQALPIPISGIMLAVASLGNLLKAVLTEIFSLPGLGYILYICCGILTLILMILILLKIVFCFRMVVDMLENPEMMGIFSTFSLTLMIFAGYLPEFTSTTVAEIFWWFGVLMHYTNMVIFTYKYVVHFKLPTLLPPWYIVYVGFALSGFSATNFAPSWFGKAAFIIGFTCFWIIFFLLIKRRKLGPIPRMDEPTVCITAAIGICLTTYVRNFQPPNFLVVMFLYLSSLIIWLWIVFKLPKLLKLPFYPTDAAFSFPFVVAAIASMETMKALHKIGVEIGAWNRPVVIIQTLVAVIMTGYASVRFILHIKSKLKKTPRDMSMINMSGMSRDMDGKVVNDNG